MTFTTHFTGWADASGTAGFLLPLGYVTRMDYRNVDFLKIYVDAYTVDSQIPDLAAPPAQAAGQAPAGGGAGGPGGAAAPITSKQIGKGIWRVDQGGTMVIELRDHLKIFELNINVDSLHLQPQPSGPHAGTAPGGGRGRDRRPAQGE